MKVARIRLASDKNLGPWSADHIMHKIDCEACTVDAYGNKARMAEFKKEHGVSAESFITGYVRNNLAFQELMHHTRSTWLPNKLPKDTKFAFKLDAYKAALNQKVKNPNWESGKNSVYHILKAGQRMGMPYKIDIFDVDDDAILGQDAAQVAFDPKKVKGYGK